MHVSKEAMPDLDRYSLCFYKKPWQGFPRHSTPEVAEDLGSAVHLWTCCDRGVEILDLIRWGN